MATSSVTSFAGEHDPLSNFYPCSINVFNHHFQSAEHAYQYMKAKHHGMNDLAENITHQKSAYDVKNMVKGMVTQGSWEMEKLNVMRLIIRAKADQVVEYRRELLTSEQHVIAEAVPGEFFWSCGLPKERVHENWPGRNMMGQLHMELRNELRKSSKNMHQISPNVTVQVMYGSYGGFVKLQRKNRKITLAAKLWMILKKNVKRLQNTGDILYLTKEKRVEVTEFKSKRYTCFIQEQNNFKTYINFNEDEWTTLLESMEDIKLSRECDVCHNLKKTTKVTKDNKMTDTKLTKEQLDDVHDWNCGVQNQLGLMCTYCGAAGYMNDECHCHRYDCKICEPDNYCSSCSSLVIDPAV